MLWDALVIVGTFVGESTIAFDGHNWVAITDNDGPDANHPHGTLFVRTS